MMEYAGESKREDGKDIRKEACDRIVALCMVKVR